MTSDTIPAAAAWLGYAGIIPFALLAVFHVLGLTPGGIEPLNGFLIYSAVILSFLGGIRWGALARSNTIHMTGLIMSVLPSLWALFVVWLAPAGLAVWLMAAGYAFMGILDCGWPANGIAPWMRRLRARLSVAVVACHLVVALA